MVRAILFDLDETLILDGPILAEAFLAAAELAAPLGADPARLARSAHAQADRLWRAGPYFDYCDRIGHSAGEGLWARYDRGEDPHIAQLRAWTHGYQLAIWREALAEQEITAADGSLLQAMAVRFQEARRRYPRFPEIDPLLADLQQQGYLLGIVTNGVPDLQREKLAGSGIAHLFPAIAVSGEVGHGKPSPAIFDWVCGELGVQPNECVMVGDNPGRDVAGAIAAGMRSVWVQRHGRARNPNYPADLECTDLSAMLPWLQQLNAK